MFRVPRFHSIRLVRGGFFISFLLVIGVTTISPVLAAPVATTTTFLSDVGVVTRSGETIQFIVWVYAGFDPVPTGPIRIIHINDTGEYIDTTILGGKAVVNWTVGEFSEGIHIFEAVFQGFMDFSPSSCNCSVQFDEFTPGSSKTTAISLSTNSTVVYKNSFIRFAVNLEIIGELHPHFREGYIYIKNTNLSGSPTIHTHGPLPLHISALYSFSFDYQIPTFTAVGINSFVAEYTGSSLSQTKPCKSSLCNVTIMSTGFSLIQSFDQHTLQREESILKFNTTVLGDYPIGLELKSYYFLHQEEVIIFDQILDSRQVTAYFSPNSTVPVGILSIITELIDPSTEVQLVYTNSTENVTIIDSARIDHFENATEYRHNEIIRFDVYVTEEDVWTHPVVAKVELIDVTNGNRSISNQTTNQDGFVVIEYSIPTNSTVGSHTFCLITHNTGQYIIDTFQTFPVVIKGFTEFDLSYESGGVDRNSVTIIKVTVLSGGNPISEGFVALEFKVNNSVIEIQSCEPGLEFHYFIKKSHPLGDMDYQVHFFGSPNYDEHIEDFSLTIFSNPHFNSSTMGLNVSTVIKGHTIRIWGQFEDETGKSVIYEEVDLTDITIGTLLGSSITDAQGIFFFDYYISESTQIGLHFIEITYAGNQLEFYHSSINSPTLSFTVRPQLSIIIETEVIADHWTVLTLEGGLKDEISLEWQKEGESEWANIGSVVLNSTGQGFFTWSTPYYKGDFTIRAIGPNSTKYDFSSMYVNPNIFVEGSGVGNSNDPYPFTVNTSEQYQIWIGGQLWQDWHVGGVQVYEYTFTTRGLREILIICNDTYVYYHEYHHSLAVFEDVFVTLSVPLEAPVKVSVNLDGTVLGEVSGPISTLDVTLEVNGTEVQVDSTNGAGNYYFSLVLDKPGYYSLLAKTPETDFYCASLSVESILLIKSNPAEVQILSPLNQTYGAIVEFSFDGNAVDYWYRIEPIETNNRSWSSSIFLELPEGNFICHLYGQNAYGVVSYASTYFTVDTTSPSLILSSPRNITYTKNDIQLSYLTDEKNVVVFLDGLELDNITSGTILTNLAGGAHNLTITSVDNVGNNVTRVVFFNVDTIPPSLEIYSPYNQSYVSGVKIMLGSNGSTVLYYISSIHSYNQTYTEPVQLNLLIGHYTLVVYAFDDSGNIRTDSVSFSIVQTIDLLLNPGWEALDEAGNYVVHAQVMSHPNFDKIGINLNGSFVRCLEWSYLSQDYRITFQLDSPGIWQVTLFANTTLEEYDFYYFEIVWNPPTPIFESISLTHDSSYYEVHVQMDIGDLSLESIQVLYNDSFYDLTKYYGNRWECQLPFIPQNMTLSFYTWYPWDENPSTREEYDILWYAPAISVEFTSTRTNFTLQLQVLKQNASIDTSSAILVVWNGTTLITVNETSFYEDLTGGYQEWQFVSPNLPPRIWNYSISITDIFGIEREFRGIFNSTDIPPIFGNVSIVVLSSHPEGEFRRVEIAVSDDYQVDSVILFVDGIERTPITQNGTYFVFEIWLDEGVHNLQVVAVDDIGQKNYLFLPSIEVTPYHSTSLTSDVEVSTAFFSSHTGNSSETGKETNSFVEIVLVGTIFSGLVATGNVINRKRRD
ncbi:MAG: hypothetical protein ACFFFH_04985 [Candidatus Thorarchaeota archaeon]